MTLWRLFVLRIIGMIYMAKILGYGVVYEFVWTYAKRLCALVMFSTSSIIFNSSTSAITNDSQSVNDIYPYFKSQLYVENSGNESWYSFYRMG